MNGKKMTNTLLDQSSSRVYTWVLAMGYVCFLLNLTLCGAVDGIPMQRICGSTPDISPLLNFAGINQYIIRLMTLIFHLELVKKEVNLLVLRKILDMP